MISKYIRSFFFIALIFSLFHLPVSLSFSEPTKDKMNQKNTASTIEITSDRMRSENGGQKIIFSGNVSVTNDTTVITSDIVEVYNNSDKKEAEEIVALGNVKITRGNKKARGDRAVYLKKLQKIILTGNPKATAWEGDDIIEGREMIFLMNKDRFVVNERVRAKLFPKQMQAK
jgi:lipopolysaccharide export system protein LptA